VLVVVAVAVDVLIPVAVLVDVAVLVVVAVWVAVAVYVTVVPAPASDPPGVWHLIFALKPSRGGAASSVGTRDPQAAAVKEAPANTNSNDALFIGISLN